MNKQMFPNNPDGGSGSQPHAAVFDRDPAAYPQPMYQQPFVRRFRATTLLFPILFILIHALVQSLVVMVGAGVIMGMHDGQIGSVQATAMVMEHITLIMLISSIICIAIYAPVILGMRHRRPFYHSLRTSTGNYLLAIPSALSGLGLCTLMMMLMFYLAQFVPWIAERLQMYELNSAMMGQGSLVIRILSIAVFAPLAEELLFRGIIFGELRSAMPDVWAVIISSILFACFHIDPVQIAYVIFPAFMLGLIRLWTESIWPCFIYHMILNLFGGVLGQRFDSNQMLTLIYSLFIYVMIPVGIFCFVLIYREKKARDRALRAAYANRAFAASADAVSGTGAVKQGPGMFD